MCAVALLHIFPRYSIHAVQSATYIGNVHFYAEQAYCRRHKHTPHEAPVWGRWGEAEGSRHASVTGLSELEPLVELKAVWGFIALE